MKKGNYLVKLIVFMFVMILLVGSVFGAEVIKKEDIKSVEVKDANGNRIVAYGVFLDTASEKNMWYDQQQRGQPNKATGYSADQINEVLTQMKSRVGTQNVGSITIGLTDSRTPTTTITPQDNRFDLTVQNDLLIRNAPGNKLQTITYQGEYQPYTPTPTSPTSPTTPSPTSTPEPPTEPVPGEPGPPLKEEDIPVVSGEPELVDVSRVTPELIDYIRKKPNVKDSELPGWTKAELDHAREEAKYNYQFIIGEKIYTTKSIHSNPTKAKQEFEGTKLKGLTKEWKQVTSQQAQTIATANEAEKKARALTKVPIPGTDDFAVYDENGDILKDKSFKSQEADDWTTKRKRFVVEKAVKTNGGEIVGTVGEEYVVKKSGQFYKANKDGVFKDENLIRSGVFEIEEGTLDGVSIKTKYDFSMKDKKQERKFISSTFGEQITIKDKAAYEAVKSQIGKLDKEKVIMSGDDITIYGKGNIPTFQAKVENEKETSIRTNFIKENMWLNEKIITLGDKYGGVTTATYEARYIYDGEAISKYKLEKKLSKLKQEEKKIERGKVVTKKVLTNYRADFYGLGDDKQTNIQKIEMSAIGTVWVKRGTEEVLGKKTPTYTSELSIEILDFEYDPPGSDKIKREVKTTDYYAEGFTEENPPKIDPNTGRPINVPSGAVVAYWEGETLVVVGGTPADRAKFEERAKVALKQAKSRRIFKTIELSLTQFSGLRGWHMLFDEEGYREWNNVIDRVFNNVLLGGTDYWVSEICRNEYDKTSGVAFGLTPEGIAIPQAHVEGEKSQILPDGQRLYKLTFYVRASYQDVVFNVYLDGVKQLYPSDILLKGDEDGDGEEFSASGGLAFVQYSANEYSKICIDFSSGPIQDICNTIIESQGSVTNYEQSGGPAGGFTHGEGAEGDSKNQKPVVI